MTSPVGQTGLAEYSLALRAGTMLADQYTIVGVLGRPGGFGITYLAEDIRLESLVAIKEFLPRELATRAPDSTAVVTHDSDGGFRHGLEQFLREARTLAKIHHPSVVRVRQFFEANGTAYLVMDYLEGETLSDLLKEQGGRLPAPQVVDIIVRVLDGLRAAHALNIYHRDVKPSNIYITSNGLPVLLDFGAARQATGQSSSKMTAVLTPGFAPLEQYGHRGQGPWTDIYAAAAVLYHAITGVDPVPATDRVGEEVDPMLPPSDIDPDIGQPLSDAIMKGLSMVARNRPQTADEFQRLLTAAMRQMSPSQSTAPTEPVVEEHHVQRPSEPVAARPTPPPSAGVPFVPSLADTLGPADLISPEPLQPSASGSSPVLPIVPSLADTLGPADIPHAETPATKPSVRPPHEPPRVSVPSLADTIAAWRVTPPAASTATPRSEDTASSSTAEPSASPIDAGSAGSAVEAHLDANAVVPPAAPGATPPALFASDAFVKTPSERQPDLEVAIQPVVESDLSSPHEEEPAEVEVAEPETGGDVSSLDAHGMDERDSTAVADVEDWAGERSSLSIPELADLDVGPPSPPDGGSQRAVRQLWARATDTRQKRIGLAAAVLVVLVGSGLLLATPRSEPQVATVPVDTTTRVSTGETTPVVDSAALRLRDSLAKAATDSAARAESLKVVAAARAKDSAARAAAAQRALAAAARGTGRGESLARGPAAGGARHDTARSVEAPPSQQGYSPTVATAEEHLRTIIDDFVSVLRSGDEGAITGALEESDRSAESRAALLKLMRERRPNVASVTPAEISVNGGVAQQYFTVKFTWREGRFRRSDHTDYAVFRATARHAAGKWSAEKPEITRPPESK